MFRPVQESRMTAWPTLTDETPGPASTTIPRASLPGMWTVAGSPFPKTGTGRPRAAKFVLKLGPQARTDTSTRFASVDFRRGVGTDSHRTEREGGPYRSRRIVRARMREGRGVPRAGGTPRGQVCPVGAVGSVIGSSFGGLRPRCRGPSCGYLFLMRHTGRRCGKAHFGGTAY